MRIRRSPSFDVAVVAVAGALAAAGGTAAASGPALTASCAPVGKSLTMSAGDVPAGAASVAFVESASPYATIAVGTPGSGWSATVTPAWKPFYAYLSGRGPVHAIARTASGAQVGSPSPDFHC